MARPNILTTIKTNNVDIVMPGYFAYDIMQLVRMGNARAKVKNVPVSSLDELYLHVMGELKRNDYRCECCRKPYNAKHDGVKGGGKDSLSLHRVVAHRGYVPSNVKTICHNCNLAIGEIQNRKDLVDRFRALTWQNTVMGD